MSKKKQNSPRRKKFKRDQRLHNAKMKWLPTAEAKNLAKSYSKWYGVDLQCAITELEMLDYTFQMHYKEQVKKATENKTKEKRKRKEEREKNQDYPLDCDETFSFIVGYTENGVPFGITYEEERDF